MDDRSNHPFRFVCLGIIDSQRYVRNIRMTRWNSLKNQRHFVCIHLLAPGRLEGFPCVADSLDLSRIEGQSNFRRTLVTSHDLERETDSGREYFRDIVRSRAGPYAADFKNSL